MPKSKYFFVNRDNFKIQSRKLQGRIEEMYETYYKFKDMLEALRKDGFIEVTALELKAGFTQKQIDKMTFCVDEYRRIFFELGKDILQMSIDEFVNRK